MNGKLFIYLCTYTCRVLAELELKQVASDEEIHSAHHEISSLDNENDTVSVADLDASHGNLNTLVYKTVNRYFCSVNSLVPSHMIVYGTKSWTFPPQDVNLTLSYPTENPDRLLGNVNEDEELMITGFEVVLYIDSDGSRGFITNGGILQESITLSFVSSNVSSLSYQFWVYGVTKQTHADDLNQYPHTYRICR